MEKQINNYEAFKEMVISTTLLGNKVDDNWKKDSLEILNFIGSAYNLNKEDLLDFEDIIINKLSKLFLISDAKYNLNVDINSSYYYDTKSSMIIFLQSFYSPLENYWLDYNYLNTYFPEIHFYNMNEASKFGHLIASKQIGLLYALGIGVEKNYRKAIHKFMQCAFWGDIPSVYMLAHIYKLLDDEINYSVYKDLIVLVEKYLNAGITEVNEPNINKKSIEMFSLISSIFQDVVKPDSNKHLVIDYSFTEVMLLESVSLKNKHYYINNYTKANWRDASNNPEEFNKSGILGFFREEE